MRLPTSHTRKSLLILLITSIILFSLLYAYALGPDHFRGMSTQGSYMDYIYFSLTTQTAVGYGDISPQTTVARGVVMLQMLVTLAPLFFIFVV